MTAKSTQVKLELPQDIIFAMRGLKSTIYLLMNIRRKISNEINRQQSNFLKRVNNETVSCGS
jgi:hypothetical protein